MTDFKETISVAMTGASGAQYGLRLIECLLAAEHQVYLMLSEPGKVVIGMETEFPLPGRTADIERVMSEQYGAATGQLHVFGQQQWTAPVASGSGAPKKMVVCPCTMGTLSAIACGASASLLERAADVVIKEQGKLVLVPRETPFSPIHLENMLKLARIGVVILPPNPGFYDKPQTLDDMIDFVVAKILDQLGVVHTLVPRWGLSAPESH